MKIEFLTKRWANDRIVEVYPISKTFAHPTVVENYVY